MAEWKKAQDEVPKMLGGLNYSEDVVFVTSNDEVHNGFYSNGMWFDVDEHWVYFADEIAEWIYSKDVEEG